MEEADETFGIGGGGPVFFAAPICPVDDEAVILMALGTAGGVFLTAATIFGGAANPRGFVGSAGGSESPFAMSFVATTVALGLDSANGPVWTGIVVYRC